MPNNKTFTEQAKTLKDAKRLLQDKSAKKEGRNPDHRCIIIRPTGFGKTYMMTSLIHEYKHVLYLYPAAVVRNTVVEKYYETLDTLGQDLSDEDGNSIDPETIDTLIEMRHIDKCDLMTYAKLIRLTPAEMEDMHYDLIICDEVHRLGAERTREAMHMLMDINRPNGTHFVGATATPCRMDDVDVAAEFFGNRMCYTFTMKDAIDTGILQKPIYKYFTYDHVKNLEAAFAEAGENPKDEEIKTIIDTQAIELAHLYNMPSIIKKTCDEYLEDNSYMKFIVFFRNIKHMDEKMPDVIEWFREAYPDYTVKTLNISSRNSEEAKNTEKLDSLVYTPKTIHLIGSVDMLNLGYHVDVTGIFMYRGTSSNIIFSQQFGRALSAGTEHPALVFDLVDNINRPAIFELKAKREIKIGSHKSVRTGKPVMRTDFVLGKDKTTILIPTAKGGYADAGCHLTDDNVIVDNITGNPMPFEYDDETGIIYNNNPEDGKVGVNAITKECLVAIDHDATYRQIIKKITAEPMVQRCKSAFELHFRTYCYNNHFKYPLSDKELKEAYGKDIDEFKQIFANSIRKHKIDYPLQDAKALMNLKSTKDNINVPLAICAKARNISVEMVLDLLFSPEWRKSMTA